MNILTSIAGAVGSTVGKAKAAYYDAAERSFSRKNLGWGRSQGRREDNAVPHHDRETIRNQAIDLYRNDPIVHGIVERFADNVVGSGITPQSKTRDETFNAEAEDLIKQVSRSPEISGRFSMVDVQRMTLRCPFIMGDMLFQILNDGKFQMIEGERIMTPSDYKGDDMLDGVKYNPSTGSILGFEVFNRGKDGCVASTNAHQFIYNHNAIFMCRPFRPDQYRGLPEISPIVRLARDLKEIREAIVKKVKMEAKDAKVVKTDTGSVMGNMGVRGQTIDVNNQPLTELDDGRIYYLRPHESVEGIESKTPTPQLSEFIEMMIRTCGASVGLPYEFVLQDFSKGNFSASRAALLQTYATFQMWQQWIVNRFLNRWYYWRISKAIKAGLIRPAPLDDNGINEVGKVYWNFPEWEWVDPQSQQQADLLAFQLGVKSHTDLVAKRGKDSEDVLREKFRNMAISKKLADEANAEYGTNFIWQDGIYANIPGQVNQAVGPADEGIADHSEPKPEGNKWLI